MSGVTIPEALLPKLLPRRSLPGSARPLTAAAIERWLKTFPKKPAPHWDKTYAELFEAGLRSKKNTQLLEERREAYALLSKLDEKSVASARLETLAVAERMAGHMAQRREQSLAPVIAAARGLADAVEVAARSELLDTDMDGGYMSAVLIVPLASPRQSGRRRQPSLALRHLVCAASPEEYAAARERAAKLRDGAELADRASLAFVFPDEPWANLDLEAALASSTNAAPLWFLLGAASDGTLVRRHAEQHGPFHLATHALDLACVLPPRESVPLFADFLPQLLAKPKYGPLLKTPPRDVVQALACVATKEAADALAPYANNAVLGPMVLAFFRDHPEHGAALEVQAKGKKLEATASRVLGKREQEVKTTVAKASELPDVLRDAPWRKKVTKERELVVDGLEVLGLDLERVALVRSSRPFTHDQPATRPMTEGEVAKWKAAVEADGYFYADFMHEHVPGGRWEYRRVPSELGLWAWNEKGAHLSAGPLAWVAAHGLETLPGFVSPQRDWVKWLGYDGHEDYLEAACSLISPRIAPVIARVAQRKRWRRIANAWLLEHAEVAAYGLVPDALSRRREARSNAEAALLILSRNGKDAVVRKVAKAYGNDAARGIEALLGRDPLSTATAVPKWPDFLRLRELPRVMLRSGKALDEDAVRSVVEMVSISTPDDPYPGLALVREACDERSLGDLATELLEQWVIGDAPGRHEWMLHAVVFFRSERGARRVAELAREWARKNAAKAERACGALAADGSDLALMHLAHIAETTRFAALKETTAGLVQDAAAARGLTEAELGDRTVPDAGLGADGRITLSYGSREFVVGCDASLAPVVREKTSSGLAAPSKSLPRPLKSDDAMKVKEARQRFDELKKDLESIGQRQVRRLERAMIDGRTWTSSDFESRIAAHPLLRHLACALVWEALPKKGKARTFRIAEDGTFADASDASFELEEGAVVRLAHPARTRDLGTTWSTVFSDYAIVQPFEQLGRTVHLPAPDEANGRELERASAITVPARKLLGTMESRGWQRDAAGFVSAWLRPVRSRSGDEVMARWPLSQGIEMESLASASEAVTGVLVVEGPEGAPVLLGDVDAVAFSEIIRDVEAVRAL